MNSEIIEQQKRFMLSGIDIVLHPYAKRGKDMNRIADRHFKMKWRVKQLGQILSIADGYLGRIGRKKD